MKKIIWSTLILLTSISVYGQGNFSKGDNVGSFGLGIGSSLGYNNGASASPGISLQLEHGIWPVDGPGIISLGGYLGYKSFHYSYLTYDQDLNYTILGVRSAYHWNGIETTEWDLYGGLMFSYNIEDYSDNFPDDYYIERNFNSHFSLSLYLGSRYYFQKNLAGFAELGYGISYLNLGIAYKFNQ